MLSSLSILLPGTHGIRPASTITDITSSSAANAGTSFDDNDNNNNADDDDGDDGGLNHRNTIDVNESNITPTTNNNDITIATAIALLWPGILATVDATVTNQ